MKHNPTDSLSVEQISDILDLWEDGQTMSDISKETGIGIDIVQNVISLEEDSGSDYVEEDDDDDDPISRIQWERDNMPHNPEPRPYWE